MAQYMQYLGCAQPLATQHSHNDAERHLSSVSKLDHDALSITDKRKLKRAAEIGLEEKFTMMKPLISSKASKEQLKSIYLVTMQIEEF
jgi:hypothetical protein